MPITSSECLLDLFSAIWPSFSSERSRCLLKHGVICFCVPAELRPAPKLNSLPHRMIELSGVTGQTSPSRSITPPTLCLQLRLPSFKGELCPSLGRIGQSWLIGASFRLCNSMIRIASRVLSRVPVSAGIYLAAWEHPCWVTESMHFVSSTVHICQSCTPMLLAWGPGHACSCMHEAGLAASRACCFGACLLIFLRTWQSECQPWMMCEAAIA